ncbi:hypothetical protein C7999DRAFT_35546 [Corynascus novoguineensis]|uniref:Secreted protein n=1 Tax=Corynascus novoguineensis TaxID=1126955 RepID=A0AAN7CL32_9PEZI|nr:hypothetical protein C7999DRAFT_35546 [Corynascus novoguineensis]
MFFYVLLVTPRLFLPPADALITPGPPCTGGLTRDSAAEDEQEPRSGPITRWQAPTFALATFDERLSSLSAARSDHSGCTFTSQTLNSNQQPVTTDTLISETITVKYIPPEIPTQRSGTLSRRWTRPVEATAFES